MVVVFGVLEVVFGAVATVVFGVAPVVLSFSVFVVVVVSATIAGYCDSSVVDGREAIYAPPPISIASAKMPMIVFVCVIIADSIP